MNKDENKLEVYVAKYDSGLFCVEIMTSNGIIITLDEITEIITPQCWKLDLKGI